MPTNTPTVSRPIIRVIATLNIIKPIVATNHTTNSASTTNTILFNVFNIFSLLLFLSKLIISIGTKSYCNNKIKYLL